MRITANLASRPFTDLGPILRRLRLAMGVLALVAIGFGAGLYALHNKASAVRAREHSLDTNIATVRYEKQSYDAMVRQPANSTVLDHAATLNHLFDAKAFSWTLAIEDLETVLPGGVQVTTLEPIRDNKNGRITLHIRVVGPRNKVVELVQNLERSRRFMAPRITGETSETAANGNQQQLEPVGPANRVTFDLTADYNPTAPGERSLKREASLEQVSSRSTARHSGSRAPQPLARPLHVSPSPKMVPPPAGGPR